MTATAMPPTMPRSVLAVATQMLLDHLDTSYKLSRINGATDNGEFYYVASRGKEKKHRVILVNFNRSYRTSILGLLEETGARRSTWLFNGQAHTGTRQIAHFGDSGRCGILWPQAMVRAYEDFWPSLRVPEEEKARRVAAHPELPTLEVEGNDGNTTRIALPSVAHCDAIYSALEGKPVVMSDASMDAINEALASGIKLVSMPNPQRVGILDAYLLARPDAPEVLAYQAQVQERYRQSLPVG